MFVHLRVVQPAFRPWTLASVYSLSQRPPAVRLEKICVCVCVHAYVYMYAHIHICVDIYAHVFIHALNYTCMCIYIYIHAYACIYIYVCIYIYIYIESAFFICVFVQTYRHSDIVVYTQLSPHTCAFIMTRALHLSPSLSLSPFLFHCIYILIMGPYLGCGP